MGKKSAKKDRAYITASEYKEEHGGHKGRLQGAANVFKRLPFNCCAISFQPFEDPVCTPDTGTVMDIINAVPYVQKFKRNPATGQPLELKDLVRLHFHKNTDGEYCCPALGKVFNENTHIVAIKPSGNVYCYEAIQELCLKPKNLRDLITDQPFIKKDIIHIQDPMNLSGRNLAEFDHVKKELTAEDEEERIKKEADPMYGIKVVTEDAKRALSALNSDEASAAFKAGGGGAKAQAERLLAEAKSVVNKQQQAGTSGDPRLKSAPREEVKLSWREGAATWNTDAPKPSTKSDDGNAFDPTGKKPIPPPYSYKYTETVTTTGAASKSFTSTSAAIATRNEKIKVLEQLKPTKKGYVRLHTNLGDLNIELHADLAPMTCENFLALAESGYYDGVKFHRSIKNFMLQGGDPTGTGKGGVSVFGSKFKDELDSRLLHNERGIVSMANAGPNTNGSQFFILYKSAKHLDYKHTVFGKVVGGFETLSAAERIETDDDDKPLQNIVITGITVFVNPYKDLIEEEKKEEEKRKKESQDARNTGNGGGYGQWFSNPAGNNAGSGGVGKYLNIPTSQRTTSAQAAAEGAANHVAKKAKIQPKTELNNFDAW